MLEMLRKRMKYIKTGNLYLCLFTLGMSISVTGPCLLDLQHMVRTDTQHIAMVYTARSIGYLLGSIIIGIILDLTRFKQATLMACNFFITITMFGIPWSRSVETLLGFMCVNGFFLGALETGGNVICLELWGKDSSPVFQGLGFTFSLGGLIAPLITAPFLENDKVLAGGMNTTTYFEEQLINFTHNISSYTDSEKDILQSIPNVIYPFYIIGVIALLVTVFYLGVCLISPTEDGSLKEESKVENSKRTFLSMFFITMFTFLIFFVAAGAVIGYTQTLSTFAVKGKLHLTPKQGSYITSAFWAAFALSRLTSVYLSIKISSLKLLIADISLVAIAAVLLLFFMPNEWALWLACITFGTGMASAYGALIGWLNVHVNITSKFSSIFNVGAAAGDLIVPFVITYFIDTIPEMFSFVTAASAFLMTVLLVILYCMFKSSGKINDVVDGKC